MKVSIPSRGIHFSYSITGERNVMLIQLVSIPSRGIHFSYTTDYNTLLLVLLGFHPLSGNSFLIRERFLYVSTTEYRVSIPSRGIHFSYCSEIYVSLKESRFHPLSGNSFLIPGFAKKCVLAAQQGFHPLSGNSFLIQYIEKMNISVLSGFHPLSGNSFLIPV